MTDFPVLTPVTDEDLTVAIRAVRTHAPEPWPEGLLCRSERVPFPCRLARWGRATLAAAGLPEQAALVEPHAQADLPEQATPVEHKDTVKATRR
ncbi:hypothetical protein [Micromonospora halophytica]|uniref:Uncharacterized protein n=1 Tax=Micromonospora halophytica TaxID=47864 RepID=A0A1C5HBT9_9ACTN|nr:hypothetical protein [Micromonospora halophytica]SCG43450.1 hypothetical protein GA0070560_103443 [Micromonospora halophytica]